MFPAHAPPGTNNLAPVYVLVRMEKAQEGVPAHAIQC